MNQLTKKQIGMLVAVLSGAFVGFLNQTLISPALPTIMVDMDISASTAQWLTTGFTLVNAIMIPVTAFLTDKYTYRRLFIVSMALFAVGAFLVGWAPSFAVMLIGRIIQAGGAGILMPMSMTIMMVMFPVEQRGRAMGIYGIILGAAPVIGPVVSGVVVDAFDWRWLFFGITLLSIIDIVAATFLFDKRHKKKDFAAHLDMMSLVLSTAGFGAILFGCSTIGSEGVSVWPVAMMVLGTLIVVVFAQRQLFISNPMLHVDILKNRRFLVSCIICMIVQAAITSNSILMPIFVQTITGHSAIYSAMVMVPASIASIVMSPVAGRIFDKSGPRIMGIFGTIGIFICTLPFIIFSPETSLITMAIYIFLRHVVLSVVNMPINTWGINALDAKLINHGNAIANTLRQVAGSFGTALMISIYSAVSTSAIAAGTPTVDALCSGFNMAFVAQAVLCAGAAVLTIACVKNRDDDVQQTDPQRERHDTLTSIMQKDVYCIHDTATVADAVRVFTNKNISAVPVVNKNYKAIGMISDGDLVRALTRRDRTYTDPVAFMITSPYVNPNFDEHLQEVMDMNVMQLATRGLITIDVHASLDEACRILGENHLKKAPVVENGKLVGVINRSDVTMFAMKKYMEYGTSHPGMTAETSPQPQN